MYGAVIGDIIGSIYEFDNHKSKDFPLFSEESAFTDDTVCTVAVAHALLRNGDFAKHLRLWGETYPDAGYGGMFGNWLRTPEMAAYNSFGNGAAMRISPVVLASSDLNQTLELAYQATAVTHNHPEGIRGACATAYAIYLAQERWAPHQIRDGITRRYGYDLTRSVDEIRPTYAFNETCMDTVPQALTCALEAKNYEDAIRNAVSIGGDSDTVAAIAGALAEALYGIPENILAEGHRRLPGGMTEILDRLYEKAGRPPGARPLPKDM